ncbi:MAG: alpha-galactosidase, partial [Saprospiraceae bacterium]
MRRIQLMVCLIISISAFSAEKDFQFSESGCKVVLKNDTLSIENSLIKRCWKWNNGNLISLSLGNQKSGNIWKTNSRQVDLFLPSETTSAANSTIKTELIPDSYQFVKHVRTTIEYSLGNLQIRKVVKIYPDCPAIATEIFYKGKASKTWFGTVANA